MILGAVSIEKIGKSAHPEIGAIPRKPTPCNHGAHPVACRRLKSRLYPRAKTSINRSKRTRRSICGRSRFCYSEPARAGKAHSWSKWKSSTDKSSPRSRYRNTVRVSLTTSLGGWRYLSMPGRSWECPGLMPGTRGMRILFGNKTRPHHWSLRSSRNTYSLTKNYGTMVGSRAPLRGEENTIWWVYIIR